MMGKLIGQGRQAEVFEWNDGVTPEGSQVIKLFRAGFSIRTIEQEAWVTSRVNSLGCPAPRTGDIVQVGGRHGIIFEKLEGPTLLSLLFSGRISREYAGMVLAEVHSKIHCGRMEELHPVSDRLLGAVKPHLDKRPDILTPIIEFLDGRPKNDTICHNDLHPDNIIMTKSGPVVIDWVGSNKGDPLADVARACCLILYGAIPDFIRVDDESIEAIRTVTTRSMVIEYGKLQNLDNDTLAKLLHPWIAAWAAAMVIGGLAHDDTDLIHRLESWQSSGIWPGLRLP